MVSQSRVFTTGSKSVVITVPKVSPGACYVFSVAWCYHQVTLSPVQRVSKSLLALCSSLQKAAEMPLWTPQAEIDIARINALF